MQSDLQIRHHGTEMRHKATKSPFRGESSEVIGGHSQRQTYSLEVMVATILNIVIALSDHH
jgi:hypothetical protein